MFSSVSLSSAWALSATSARAQSIVSLTDGDFEPCVANLYRAARWLYVHELTEWFRVDGVPFVTAHRNGDTVHTSIDAPDGSRIEKPMLAGRP